MSHIKDALIARIQTWKGRNFKKTIAGRNLKKYKNIHENQSCFFIGNGPSLRADDLTRIAQAGYPTFAFNRIYYIFDQTNWRPDYYFSQDKQMLAGCCDQINTLNLPHKFIAANMKWDYGINIENAEEYHLDGSEGNRFWFSDDIAQGVCCANTVMYTAAQFAAYMGFTTIYLIGVDHHFHISRDREGNIVVDDTVKDYFTDAYNHDKDQLVIPSTDISTDTYYAMKRFCDERNIRVFNATRGGKLEVFERVNFDELF